nr:aldehyde dehydrogenase family protein [Providencia rettgeri]
MSINTNSTLFRQQAYINGQWVDAQNNNVFEVTNPANNHVIAKVSNVGALETQQAIEAAEKALPAWRAKTAKERSQILNKWFHLMMENQTELAQLLSAEQGK